MHNRPLPTWTTFFLLVALMTLVSCSDGTQPASPESEKQVEGTPSGNAELLAVVETDRGSFRMRLRPDLAPMSTANFINLANRGFYHGKEVVASNRISTSYGQSVPAPRYNITNEYSPKLVFNRPGIVAWTFQDTKVGTTNQISHPTRFFISKEPNDKWTFAYCPFAEVVEGQDVVNAAQAGDWIRSVRIIGETDALMARYADSVAKWNNALRLAGQFSPDELEDGGTQIPPPFINSN